MKPEDKLCYCFHITQRKILNYLRVTKPRVASQLSECGSAGTGCGWCIPFLKKHFEQWKNGESPESVAEMSTSDYADARAEYVRSGGGKPPAGAEPLPDA